MSGTPAKSCVVITGSTRGFGYYMARELLHAGMNVVISGRSSGAVQRALDSLSSRAAVGFACDVRNASEIDNLWDFAVEKFGVVDIWINNAGKSQSYRNIWEIDDEEYRSVIETNILGMMYGSRRAFLGMTDQGKGRIFNVEGWGSDGKHMKRLNIYGTTKNALSYFTKGLEQESRKTGIIVGYLKPGMMVTDFLTGPMKDDPERIERSQKIFNILADKPETVARYFVPRLLAVRRTGVRISWLSTFKIMLRFLSSPFTKRNVFDS